MEQKIARWIIAHSNGNITRESSALGLLRIFLIVIILLSVYALFTTGRPAPLPKHTHVEAPRPTK